jgi:hypothetical protein
MNGLFARLRSSLTDNVTLKLLALVIAITMVRMSRVNSNNKIRSIEVPYQLIITEPDRVFVRPPPSSVIVTLRTGDPAVWRLDERTIRPIKRELSGKDNRWLRIDKRELAGIPIAWVEKIEPEKFLVSFEAVVERPVKVEARLEGEVKGGYEFEAVEVEPDSVQVTGPQSLVSKISVMRTRAVSLVGRSRSIRLSVSLEAPPYGVGLTTPGQMVDVSLKIKEQRGTKTFQNIPIKFYLDDETDEVTSTPEAIDIVLSGTLSKVKALDVKDIEVWIDADEASVGQEVELLIAVQVPEDFETEQQTPRYALVTRNTRSKPERKVEFIRPSAGKLVDGGVTPQDAGVE